MILHSIFKKTCLLLFFLFLFTPQFASAQSKEADSLIDEIALTKTAKELNSYISQPEIISSQSLCEAVLIRARALENEELINKATTQLGKNLFNQGKYDSTIVVLGQWGGANTESPAPMELVERNFYKAVAHYYVGEYQTAVELFLSTVNEPVLKTDPKFYGRYLRVLGEVYRAADNLDPALEYLQTALEIAETNSDSVGIAASLNRLGVVYYQKAEHEISEKLLQRSLEVSIDADVTSVISSNFNDLGELYFATKEYEKCLDLYEQALEYARDNDGRINTLNNIARLDWKLSRYKEAISTAKEALILADENNILTYKVDATKIIADSYQELGQYSEATYYYKEYISFRERLFEEEQRRQILELETQYQTEQKEQEIVNLQARETAQRERNLVFLIGLIVVGLFLIILLMLFFQIRKSNSKISSQNEKLAELNSTKDKFFSIIAHDLRSPMVALHGVGQKLDYFIRKEKYDKLLEVGGKIDQSIDQLNHLLNNLLNWATSQSQSIPYHPERLLLNDLIQENVALYQSLAEAKSVAFQFQTKESYIYADLNTVSTVFRNVLSNALKFSPENGIIRIEALPKADKLIVAITDQGSGMAQAQVDQYATRLSKSTVGTKGEKGFGLGLKLCLEFMALNQGSMQINSELGKGTTVELTFMTKPA